MKMKADRIYTCLITYWIAIIYLPASAFTHFIFLKGKSSVFAPGISGTVMSLLIASATGICLFAISDRLASVCAILLLESKNKTHGIIITVVISFAAALVSGYICLLFLGY